MKPMVREEEFYKQVLNWSKTHHGERFGQYIWNTIAQYGRWESPEGNALFFLDDEDLVRMFRGYERGMQGDLFDGNDRKE